MSKLAAIIGKFLAPIITPIIQQALKDFFTQYAEIAKSNEDLDELWIVLPEDEDEPVVPDGIDANGELWRADSDIHSTGDNGSDREED